MIHNGKIDEHSRSLGFFLKMPIKKKKNPLGFLLKDGLSCSQRLPFTLNSNREKINKR